MPTSACSLLLTWPYAELLRYGILCLFRNRCLRRSKEETPASGIRGKRAYSRYRRFASDSFQRKIFSDSEANAFPNQQRLWIEVLSIQKCWLKSLSMTSFDLVRTIPDRFVVPINTYVYVHVKDRKCSISYSLLYSTANTKRRASFILVLQYWHCNEVMIPGAVTNAFHYLSYLSSFLAYLPSHPPDLFCCWSRCFIRSFVPIREYPLLEKITIK